MQTIKIRLYKALCGIGNCINNIYLRIYKRICFQNGRKSNITFERIRKNIWRKEIDLTLSNNFFKSNYILLILLKLIIVVHFKFLLCSLKANQV